MSARRVLETDFMLCRMERLPAASLRSRQVGS
jgi:hypothetical protein